ncbi:MAG TPA: penicillin-binding protein 1C [Rhodanobacter sp.]|nr:penicillin-binding protein 1C [Rhodanobacter sp.]
MRTEWANAARAGAGRWLRRWQNVLAALGLIAAILIGCRLWPHPSLRDALPRSTAIHDDAGHLLRLTLASDDQYRLWTPLAEISPPLVDATLMHEDQWYWWHPGFNPWGLLRGAWITYVRHGHPQGGSTITMQLARLLYRLDTRTPLGKLHQVALALRLELFYSKKDILAAYLNSAPYGGNIQGVGAASLVYFEKSAARLSLPEALTLAVIPQDPSRRLDARHGPDVTVVAPRLAAARDRLFQRWLRRHPDDARWRAVFRMPLALHTLAQLPFEAPHAVDQLIASANAQGEPLPSQVRSTIDLGLQQLLERQVRDYVQHMAGVGVRNASAMLVDTRSMDVKALVGSVDYFNKDIHGQVNGTLASRSPGSTLKPFIYGLGLDQGVLGPQTVLRDVPSSFGPYTPENFDGRFLGPVTATQALIHSRNIPAVWVDAQLRDPDLYGFLRQAGVQNLASEQHYGLALVLGGGDVTMQDLARMYALLANRGVLKPLRLRQDVPAVPGKRLLSEAASFIVTDMLEQNPRPGTTFGSRPAAAPVFWKTGTSWAFHDAWTAGGFGPYVLVVWVGNFDSTPNPAFVGIDAAAPLFFRIHDALLAGHPQLRPPPRSLPDGLKRVRVCLATGMLPSRWCPATGETWFIPGVSPIKVGNVYRPVVIDNASGLPACPPYAAGSTRTEVFQYWPSDLAAVFARAGIPIRKPPHNPACANAGQAQGDPPAITSPLRGASYALRLDRPEGNAVVLAATSDADVRALYWFVNDAYIGRATPAHALAWQPLQAGNYQLRVVDDHGSSDARSLEVGVVQ